MKKNLSLRSRLGDLTTAYPWLSMAAVMVLISLVTMMTAVT